MEKTLEEQKRITNVQYVLESLIEYYEMAKKESDRYYIKGQLLEFIDDYDVSLNFVKMYMNLQPEKFDPFIKTLSNVECRNSTKKKDAYFTPENVEVRTYIYRK